MKFLTQMQTYRPTMQKKRNLSAIGVFILIMPQPDTSWLKLVHFLLGNPKITYMALMYDDDDESWLRLQNNNMSMNVCKPAYD